MRISDWSSDVCSSDLGVLGSGAALAKFLAICEAQGGFREPPRAAFTADVPAPASGRIAAIDNRRLAKLAKLAGAPTSPPAGLDTGLRIGATVERGSKEGRRYGEKGVRTGESWC